MNDEEVVGWLCKMLGGERERMDGGSMSGGQLVKIIGRSLGSDSVLN
jgi:glutamate/tyrosine decarboxylase-like PLP-dependent enzyme